MHYLCIRNLKEKLMIVYNTTFHIEDSILEECVSYLKRDYIPKAISSGFLFKPCFRKILHTLTEEGSSFSIQFHVKNAETLNHWLQTEGSILNKELTDRFGDRIAGFTTLLEELDWEK